MPLPDRESRGRSQLNDEDYDLLKLASQKRWVFYTKGDQVPVIMEYNSTLWPADFSVRAKLDLKNGDKVRVKSTQVTYNMSLVCICETEKVKRKAKQVVEKAIETGGNSSVMSLNETVTDPEADKENFEHEWQVHDPSTQPVAQSPDVSTNALKRTKSLSLKHQKKPRVVLGEKSIQANPSAQHVVNMSPVAPVRSTPIEIGDSILASEMTPQARSCQCEKKIDKLNEKVDEYLRQMTETNEKVMRKFVKQNRMLQNELLEVFKRSAAFPTSSNAVFHSTSDKGEAIEFNGQNLLDLRSTDGPSAFGRVLASQMFGEGKDCQLAEQRLGLRVEKKNTRKSVDPELERIFKEVVERNFPHQKEDAVREAFRGANQYGAEARVQIRKSSSTMD